MILVVCIQNSITTLAGYSDDGSQVFSASTATDPRATSDRLAVDYSQLMMLCGVKPTDASGGIIASVVPAMTDTASDAVKRIIGRRPMTIGPGTRTGFAIESSNPSELGADIVAVIAGALAKFEPPLVVAYFCDMLVVAAVDDKHRFRGCAIVPGVKTSLEALKSAALFSSLGFNFTDAPMGLTTKDAVNSGLSYGIAGAAEALARRMCDEVGADNVVVTGEQAGEFARRSSLGAVEAEGLLCDGLYAIYVKNAQTGRR